MFTKSKENNVSKHHSRYRVARSINSDGNHQKIVHYLGGVSEENHFESFFSTENTTFIRYERESCNLPKRYCPAWKMTLSPSSERYTFHVELNQKSPDQYGYFVNEDFFTESQKFMQLPEIVSKKNYFWLDFCGMPSDNLIGQVNDFVKSYNQFAEEIYLTFFMNPRSMQDVKQNMGFCNSLEDKAKSLCATLKEKICVDYSIKVLDVYVNGKDPMAVIKMKKKIKMKKTKQQKHPICNSENYAIMRSKGFSNQEIETMWRVPHMAVAAYQAWNTMSGRKWNDVEQDEHEPENVMI